MKTLNKVLLILASALFLFTACEEKIVDREPSPLQEGGIQAYFYEGTKTSLSFLPDNDPVFKIKVGRNNTGEAATLTYTIVDEDDIFEIPSSVTFAAGEALAEIEIDFSAMSLGMTAKLTLELNENDAYIYGLSAVTVTVLRDYKWLPAGIVEMTSQWAEATADVEVQHAEGTNIYRLVSPYYILEEDYADEGYHLLFELDEDYNALKFYERQSIGEESSAGTPIEIFYGPLGDSFTNNKNIFTLSTAFIYINAAGNLSGWTGISEVFIWKEGYEGEIGEGPNYFEGEAETTFDIELAMSDALCVWYNRYSNPGTDTYYLGLEDGKGNYLDTYLFAEEDENGATVLKTGTYIIDESGEAGTAQAGYKPLGGEPDGTVVYLSVINSYFYLIEGEIVVEKEGDVYTISVDAVSAFGSNVKAEWTGNLDVEDILLMGAPKKSNEKKDLKKMSKRANPKLISSI